MSSIGYTQVVLTNDQARAILEDLTRAQGMALELRSLEEELSIMQDRDRMTDMIVEGLRHQIQEYDRAMKLAEMEIHARTEIGEEWKKMYEKERGRKKIAILTGAGVAILVLFVGR